MAEAPASLRLDKFLWFARIVKTRALAQAMTGEGRLRLNGRVVDRLPGAVARCTSAEEVAQVIRFCRERKIPVVARGQGHSQTGQSTTDGGVLIDTSAMRTIHEIDEENEIATVDAGVVWRSLVEATVPLGLVSVTRN